MRSRVGEVEVDANEENLKAMDEDAKPKCRMLIFALFGPQQTYLDLLWAW